MYHSGLCLQDVVISRRGHIMVACIYRMYWYPEVATSWWLVFTGFTDIQKRP